MWFQHWNLRKVQNLIKIWPINNLWKCSNLKNKGNLALFSVFWALLKNYKELLHIKCTNRLPLTYRMCVPIIFHLLHFLVHVLLDHHFQRTRNYILRITWGFKFKQVKCCSLWTKWSSVTPHISKWPPWHIYWRVLIEGMKIRHGDGLYCINWNLGTF